MATGQSRRNVLKAGSLALLGMGATGRIEAATQPPSAGIAPEGGGATYTLPPLPYGYDALTPLYDEKTLRIHHTKHHAGYVRGLNRTLDKLETARKSNDYGSIKALSRDLAFNGSGHVLHSLFWNSMSPAQPDVPDGLAGHLTKSFGSVEAAKNQFAAATKAVEGSGWGLLVYEPIAEKLLVLQAEKHQNLTLWNATPLLACDVWEHAYYLQYANDRGTWVDTFMKMANWPCAAARLQEARKAMTM